jgi:Fe(II)/alpha-ketoglutarate-dependent arginine beta-hydroxylase
MEGIDSIYLSNEEIGIIRSILKEIAFQYSSAEDVNFLKNAVVFAHELPRIIRRLLNNFNSLDSQSCACLISGYPVDDGQIGKTSAHWSFTYETSPTLFEEILFILYSSLLGDVFGWATQQDGRIIHNIMPIKAYENEQLGFGSQQELWWHTEDAFHPYRGDYVGFLCLRNLDRVVTTLASIDMVQLEPHQVKILFQPRFTIRPDESHQKKNSFAPYKFGQSAFSHIDEMNANPDKISVLFGSPNHPYLRIDPFFMAPLYEDEEAKHALEALIHSINSNLMDLVLSPGDYLFIDNYKAVHGRKPFCARYDGNDRWLKRINITKDLRKSRDIHNLDKSRIIL